MHGMRRVDRKCMYLARYPSSSNFQNCRPRFSHTVHVNRKPVPVILLDAPFTKARLICFIAAKV